MGTDIVILLAGLGVLVLGAELMVRGSASLARHLGLTPLVIGLTVVAFGTSAPEMMVSVGGSFRGQDDLAIANVVGSNIFNIGFILGLTALLCPITIHLDILRKDIPVMLGISVLACFLIGTGLVGRVAGVFLLVLLVAYTWWSVRLARTQAAAEMETEFDEAVPPATRSIAMDLLLIPLGLGLLVFGSRMLSGASISIARELGVSDAIIGLTIVAAGTSMPELASSLAAAARRHPDMAVGNVVGSNVFNLLGILGLSASAKPLVTVNLNHLDLWVMTGLSVLALPLCWTQRKMHRWEGALLLAVYVSYVALRWPR